MIVESFMLSEAVGCPWTASCLSGELVLAASVFWLVFRGRGAGGRFPGVLAARLPADCSWRPGCGLFSGGQAAAGAAAAVVAVRAWRASRFVRAVMALRMLWLAAPRGRSGSAGSARAVG